MFTYCNITDAGEGEQSYILMSDVSRLCRDFSVIIGAGLVFVISLIDLYFFEESGGTSGSSPSNFFLHLSIGNFGHPRDSLRCIFAQCCPIL